VRGNEKTFRTPIGEGKGWKINRTSLGLMGD